MKKLTAERMTDVNRTFSIRDQAGEHIITVCFREICALAAVEAGRARAMRRRRSWYGLYDEWLEPHTDLFGIGPGTLGELQRDDEWHPALVTRCADPDAALELTDLGQQVLAAVRAAGVDTLLTEAIAS